MAAHDYLTRAVMQFDQASTRRGAGTCKRCTGIAIYMYRKVNISHGRPTGRTQPDVSVTTDAGCLFHRQPAVTPTRARAANHTHRFLVEE